VRPGTREDATRSTPRRVRDGDGGDGDGDGAAKAKAKAKAGGGVDGGGGAKTAGMGDGVVEDAADDGLRIAWQYRRYLKEGRALDDSRVGASQTVRAQPSSSMSSSSSKAAKKLRAPDMCHRYDVTKEEDAETLAAADISFKSFGLAPSSAATGGDERWASCYQFVAKFVRETNALGEASLGRVFVQPETPSDEDGWASCVQLVRALKGLTYGTNCATVIILSLESAPARVATLIRHVVDCAIDVQALDGPTSDVESLLPDPHTCIGLVAVRKIQFQGSVVSPLVRMDRVYALQMRRKRMAIKPLQLRPEDDSRDATSSAACGTGAKGGLDDF
jgi:elongator complex protein 4